MSRVTQKTFVKIMKQQLTKFDRNLSNFNLLPPKKRSMTQWMTWFLDWSEWKTEMHDEYWGEEDE